MIKCLVVTVNDVERPNSVWCGCRNSDRVTFNTHNPSTAVPARQAAPTAILDDLMTRKKHITAE